MFRKDRSRTSGRYPYCKSCEKAGKRAWYLQNADHAKSKAKTNRSKNKDKYAAVKKKWQQANPDKIRAIALKYNFNISLEKYSQMLQSQHGVCAICRITPEEGTWMCVDHDHKSGAIRGLLCGPCNKMLGFARDNEETLESAISYLRKNAL
jgi:hypothetical protein